jgi:hypothetical protein
MSLDSPLERLDGEASTSFDYEEQLGEEEVKEDSSHAHLQAPSAAASRSPARQRRHARDHSSPIVKRLNGLFTQQQPEARRGRKEEEEEEEMKV